MTAWIEHLVNGAGIAAPIAFVAIYALPTIALVPGTAPSMAAGALFGAAWGTLLTVLGRHARRHRRVPVRAARGPRPAARPPQEPVSRASTRGSRAARSSLSSTCA